MKPQFFVLAGCLACLAACGRDVYEIGEAMADEVFWKSDPEEFVHSHREQGFASTSDPNLSIQTNLEQEIKTPPNMTSPKKKYEWADSRLDGAVTYFGVPVYESRIEFVEEGSGIAHVELTLYSEAGTESYQQISDTSYRRVRKQKNISRDEFLGILNQVRGRLTPQGSKDPVPASQWGKRQGRVTWPKTAIPTATTLVWNYDQEGNKAATFKPGFVRVSIDGPARLAADAARGTSSSRTRAKGRKTIMENVVRNPSGEFFADGDVVLKNVPMVDQGQKGYCAAATSERVMRYYGVEMDEHEIGQAAGTTADEGTSPAKMRKSIDMIGKRFRLATQTLYGDFEEDIRSIQRLEKEVANYNKAAKKLKKAEIAPSVYIHRDGGGFLYDSSAADKAMDPDVLMDMKINGAQKSKYKKFLSDVHQYVNQGIPLMWGVKFGVYREPNTKQELGYHMRLIIGYNDKKREILYSDSWGEGHELKRMPADWAWTISRSLMVMKPLR